jgi:hypothetical protein
VRRLLEEPCETVEEPQDSKTSKEDKTAPGNTPKPLPITSQRPMFTPGPSAANTRDRSLDVPRRDKPAREERSTTQDQERARDANAVEPVERQLPPALPEPRPNIEDTDTPEPPSDDFSR